MAKQTPKNKKVDPAIWVILIGGLMLVAAVVVLLVQAGQSPQGSTNTQNPNIPFPQVERVSVEDAKAAFDNGTAVFVDTRSLSSYNASHIPGAISMPEEEVESRFTELDPNSWIITYCT